MSGEKKSLRRGLKHAFAVEPSGPADPTDEERAAVERLCREVVRRRLVTPALLFLEMSRPLNYLGAQAMHFFQPLVGAVLPTAGWERLAGFLERRGSIEYLCRRLEEMEGDAGGDADAPEEPEETGEEPARAAGPAAGGDAHGEH